MLGWKTYSFGELQIVHHRLTGTAEGLLRDRIKHGVACYVSGYHPLFLLASCVSRLMQKPYVAGSAAIFYGFLKGYWIRMPRVNDKQLIKYLRAQQLRRLCGLKRFGDERAAGRAFELICAESAENSNFDRKAQR